MWKRTPALFLGLYLYAGMSFAIQGSYLAFFPLVMAKRHLPLALLVMGLAYAYTPKLSDGTGHLHISEIRPSRARFAQGWIVKGKVDGTPVYLYMKSLPKAANYAVEGSIERGRLRPKKMIELGGSGFAYFRYHMKERARRYLEGQFQNRRSGAFLAGLVTGDFSEPSLLFDFGKLGLQHLMAISGFHFSLIALVLSFVLRPLLPYKWAASFLIVLLLSYFLLIGNAPSVQRAFVMALVTLLGWIFEKRTCALNTLGIALIVVLLLDPFAVNSLGFQFSFLCTAAILFFYAPIERRLFSHYTLADVSRMSRLDQHGFLILSIVRKGLALGLAVHLVALPLILFYFHKFPLLSFAYNLIFPFLVGLVLLLLPFALVLPFLFCIEEVLISFILNLSKRIPTTLAFSLHISEFPLVLLVLYLLALLWWRYEPTRNPILQPRRAFFCRYPST